jgi:hypothetical protein
MPEKKSKSFLVTVHFLAERTYRVEAADEMEAEALALDARGHVRASAGPPVAASEIYQYSEVNEERGQP